MFLRSLTLSGFKSFADTTTLEFEPGVTVVVGPNGSGKSNVVDAIAWVLGAQGPRTLRGQKMDDVVFAGTDRRVALGRAQVTLVIDNESQTLPTQTAEVAITRTLFRSGESEYAVNGTPWRLLDLQELLNDAGVGRQQHILVAQGQIEHVLAARPEERRALIEEAAGVLKFRRRKERAERRLEGTEANVTRLVDLQRELRRQLRPLEKQAQAARRHRELSSEIADLRLHIAGRELTGHRAALGASEARRGELGALAIAVSESIAALEAAIDASQAQMASANAEPSDRLSRVASMSERARGLIGQVYERMRFVERDTGALLASDVVATLTDEHERITAELAELASADVPEGESESTTPRSDDLTDETGQAAVSGGIGQADAALAAAAAELAVAAETLADADTERRKALGELQRWIGRSEALSTALRAARENSGITELETIDGMLGVLVDLIDIDEGWESATEAASDAALGTVVVRDDAAAAAALSRLAASETSGAVVALADPASTGAPRLRGDAARGPGDGEPVRAHVRASCVGPAWVVDGVNALLDSAIGSAVCVVGDWAVAFDRALAERDTVFVTDRGDRFGPRRWRIGTAGPAAAAAALEEARARIVDLTRTSDDAEHAWNEAKEAHEIAAGEHTQRLRDAETARRRAATAQARRVAHAQARDARAVARRKRRSTLEQRRAVIEHRLAGHDASRSVVAARLARSEAMLAALDRLSLLLTERRQRLDAEAKRLRARQSARVELIGRLADRLDAHRRERDAAIERREALRSELAVLDVSDAERRTKGEAIIEMLRTDLGADAEAALGAPLPVLPDGVTAAAHLRALRSELSRLGPVNPLALSEFESASERYEFVAGQLADVRNGRRELHKVIRAIDAEIVATFQGAFADVAQNFAVLFGTLFPGGTGTLTLTEPQEPLTTGVELDVRPAGKRVGRLSLLSGGERSLVALAYLFAVFRSRPSPFYVLDEVEAALDDVNLQRFLDLVAEFRREAQLIVVSHQRRTMEAADVLYGVSMPPGGSSVVVSERPERAAALIGD
ncbi:chromosome segregation SMC family protein [Candidatus Poriferisodalis sp.]|uniref:chromosome segregation SMC family protein n=1 Tax=Candidatus Poriferisodalis sp. TaxID=3101277 RepID=UPI003D110AC0